jgi:hypothetical protein
MGKTYSEIEQDVHNFLRVGGRAAKAIGGLDRLIRGGVDHVLGSVVRENMETRLSYLEHENQVMREVLIALVQEGGEIVVLAPTKLFALNINKSTGHITVKRT